MRSIRQPERAGFAALAITVLATCAWSQEVPDPAGAKRKRLKDDAAGFWIYDDLQTGRARAKKTGRPLLVSFRCVP